MELATGQGVTSLLVVGLILASMGCASASKLAEIDAKYDAAIVRCEAANGYRAYACSDLEVNRRADKEYANSPLARLATALGLRGGIGTGRTVYINVVN